MHTVSFAFDQMPFPPSFVAATVALALNTDEFRPSNWTRRSGASRDVRGLARSRSRPDQPAVVAPGCAASEPVFCLALVKGQEPRLGDPELQQMIRQLLKKEGAAWLDLARVLVPVAGFLGVGIGVSKAGAAGRPEFYRAAISVIPTLLLTLAVQGRFFRLSAFARSPLYEELRHRHITTEHLRGLGLGLPRWALWLFLYSIRRTTTPLGTARYALTLLLILAGGEAAAFYVVAVGSPSSFYLGAVAASMAAAFLAIGTLALFGGLPEAAGDDPRRAAAQHGWHRVLEELIKRRDDSLRNGTSGNEEDV